MKDADGKDIISGEIYRDFGATALDFDSAYSGVYFVRQLPSGLVVAKDEKGVCRKVISHEEFGELLCTKGITTDIKRVYSSRLYLCNEQDVLTMQDKLERSRKRIPGLISLLNNVPQKKTVNEEEPFFLEVFVMNDPTSGNPVPIVRPAKKQSQPKCTVEETTFPFPYEDPNSPGHNPFKRGGDNPNPHIKY